MVLLLICAEYVISVLLNSDEGDEIVECDNCGITVHEGTEIILMKYME